MKKIRQSGFSKGYKVKNNLANNQLDKKFAAAEKKAGIKGQFPNGMVPFYMLILLYLVVLIAFLVWNLKDPIFKDYWFNAILASGLTYFFTNMLWLIGRTGLMNFTGYGFLKVARVLHYERLREKIHIYTVEPASKQVSNYQEYGEYCTERKAYTKKWCYISAIAGTVIGVLSIVVYLVCYYNLTPM